jgi:spore maturation protein CgeB
MRILILGAGGAHRTEGSLARAAGSLGHTVAVLDALGWRRRVGRWCGGVLRQRAERFRPDYVLCTRHAAAAGESALRAIVAGRDSAFWYFDAVAPLPESVAALGRVTARTFATYGYQVEAFLAAGAPAAHFLPQGMDPALDHPAESCPASYMCDASFVGSGQYPRRHGVLQAVAETCRLQIRGPQWTAAPAGLPVAGGKVSATELPRVIRGAAISLGIDALDAQRMERRGGTSNRLWRVLGAGGVFLGEHVPGLDAFARHGEHAVWYRTAAEAADLTRQLLRDPGERSRIARTGRAHALAQHTYRDRLERLLAGQGYTST